MNRSAFPVTPTDRGGQCAPTEWGMSLREYFIAHAPFTTEDARNALGGGVVLQLSNAADRAALIAVLAQLCAEYADTLIQTPHEIARMRDRIERLRGLCKTAVGFLRDAGQDDQAEEIATLIGDMEPTA